MAANQSVDSRAAILFTISLNSAKVWNRGFNWPVFGVGMHEKSPNAVMLKIINHCQKYTTESQNSVDISNEYKFDSLPNKLCKLKIQSISLNWFLQLVIFILSLALKMEIRTIRTNTFLSNGASDPVIHSLLQWSQRKCRVSCFCGPYIWFRLQSHPKPGLLLAEPSPLFPYSSSIKFYDFMVHHFTT